MTTIEKKVLSSDGKHLLSGVVLLPEGEAKGYVQVVHGMCEYLGRYQGFLEALAAEGYIAFGYDHLGHGKTAAPQERGFIADKDGWKLLIRDVSVFRDAVVKEYGEKPWFLFGHSMGSFIVRGAVAFGARPEKLIVCGTGGPNPASGAGLAMCKTIGAFCGGHHVSKLVGGLAFGSYNKRFADEKDSAAWLTKDRAIRDRYRDDPLCNYSFQVSAMGDLIQLQKYVNEKAQFASFPKDLPAFFIAGTDDPVGDYGAGVKKAVDALSASGCAVRMKLYENCRHEILNDSCREEVIADILEFIKD